MSRRFAVEIRGAGLIGALLMACAHARTPDVPAEATGFDPPPSPELVAMSTAADQRAGARDFQGAVAVFQEGWSHGIRSSDSAFDAACAAAQGGLIDAGFEWLVRASAPGLGTMVEAAHHREVTYGGPALAIRKPGPLLLGWGGRRR